MHKTLQLLRKIFSGVNKRHTEFGLVFIFQKHHLRRTSYFMWTLSGLFRDR